MKKLIVSISIIILPFLFGFIFLDEIRSFVVKNLNENQKQYVREVFFGKGEAGLIQKYKTFGKMNYNQLVLPDTQFLKIDYKKIQLKDLKLDPGISKWIAKSVEVFLEQYDDLVIISDSAGNIYSIKKKDLSNEKNNFKKFKTNFKFKGEKGSIRDLLVYNDDLYISYSDFDEDDCTKINIAFAKIRSDELNFRNFFSSSDCSGEFDAGRMSIYNLDEKTGLIITTDTNLEGDGAQEENSSFGKVLFIDFENKNKINFAKGLRVPQGLYVEDNLILTAEHGPRGGDEINKIEYKKNYGWPIVSYGEPYGEKDGEKDFFYKKNHEELGFEEPIYAFVPSIGINQIIKVPGSFSKFWKDDFLVTSLNGRSIYRIKMDKKISRVISIEKIFIGKRIRDIIFVKDLNFFLLALEGQKLTNSSDNISSLGLFRPETK